MSSPSSSAAKRKRFIKPLLFSAVAVVAVGAVAFVLTRPKTEGEPYRVQPVSMGSITKSVSASGTLQPLVTVEVGAQVSGQIDDVLVDFGSRVTKGQILAKIDPQTQNQRLSSARAELDASNQAVKSAEANLEQAKANLAVAQADYNRTKALFDQKIVAQSALETAEAKLLSQRATITVQTASVRSAEARREQTKATVRQAEIDLSRTTIYSPIDGVVVDRQVDPGQTVASSLSAPVLFNIAQDLSKLELKIMVDEADIGQVAAGQQVNFTVDAFPNDRFRGEITQVRKQPETAQNVVAYVVIAQADNPDEKLLPGMTVNAEIVLERHQGVMRAPTAALRWTPADQQPATGAGGRGGGGFGGGGFGGGGGGGGGFGARGGGGGGGGGFAARAGGGAGARGGQAGRGNILYTLDQIDLQPTQIEKIDKIMEEQRKTNQAANEKLAKQRTRGDQIDMQAVRREMQERQAAVRKQVEAILTPAQKAQMAAIESGDAGPRLPRGQVYVLKDGKPVRVGVGIGVSDGQNTEVVSPRLKVNDQVIISGGPRPKVQAAATGAPGVGGARPGGGGFR
jgi:HlyD family secretion protein